MNYFNKVKAPSLEKFNYNLSHEFKMSTNFGYLTPICFKEVLPGDTFQMNSELFMRMAPLVHPILQRINVDIHHFFVPYRIIWNEWEEFITGKVNKSSLTPLVSKVPTIIFNNLIDVDDYKRPNSLPHYFGVPLCKLSETGSIEISQLPFRAYQQIYNDYYRDSIKQDEVEFDKGSTDLTYSSADPTTAVSKLIAKRLRSYAQDYFTTAQPEPQYGSPAVLPSPVIDSYGIYNPENETHVSTSGNMYAEGGEIYPSSALDLPMQMFGNNGQYQTLDTYGNSNDFTEPFTINKLKELFSLQKLFDTSNKFGERYIEQVFGHFGVKSSDSRLQRAQYLGGGRIPVQINQVSQLSESTETSPLGIQAGQGFAGGSDNHFNETFEEHGLIISILSIIPEANYTSGVNKFMLKKDRYDFAFPELSTLGEQEVDGKEWDIENPQQTFGYQERYAEYKSAYNYCAGDFLTDLTGFYVDSSSGIAQDVTDLPFVVEPFNMQNIFAVTDVNVDKFYCQVYNNINKATVLPYLNRTPNPTSWA